MKARDPLAITWARAWVDALADAGVCRAVVSPGSRSTPLVVALAESPRFRTDVIIDERSAAFFALGQGRATREPTLLVCTSGSAGAHYFPAIVEASEQGIPLLVATADRPWEAGHARAHQTVDQVKWYGHFVRISIDVGAPEPLADALGGLRRMAVRLTDLARGPRPGPVHANLRFRKPLEPGSGETPAEIFEASHGGPVPTVLRSPPGPVRSAAGLLATWVRERPRGLVVCGPADVRAATSEARASLASFATTAGYPVFAEATSQMRFGAPLGDLAIGWGDFLFRRTLDFDLAPDVVVEIGRPPVSGGYAQFLSAHPGVARVSMDFDDWGDPCGRGGVHVVGDPYGTLAEARILLEAGSALTDRGQRATYQACWRRAEEAAGRTLEARGLCGGAEPLTEGCVARIACESLPEGGVLILGNSRPIRDIDAFVAPSSRPLEIHHQRGASGIDGLLAGGAGARSVTSRPVLVLLGDVAFQHDVSSLATLRDAQGPLVAVVILNGGGRIFDELPVARRPEVAGYFTRFFRTPPAVDATLAARAFGVASTIARTPAELADQIAAAMRRGDATVIAAEVAPSPSPRETAEREPS